MENINKGDRIEISTYPTETDVYISILDAIIDDTQVIVFMPINHWYFVKLAPDKEYYLSFLSNVDASILRFRSNIVKYSKKGDFYFILFKLIGKGERIERRSFYRFSYQVPFVFYKIGETDGLGIDLNIYYDGLLLDISGGGIRFLSNEDVDVNKHVSCLITLGKEQLITDGLIVNKKPTPQEVMKMEYRVKFGDDPINQDKIVQFIFDEQRKGNKKVQKIN